MKTKEKSLGKAPADCGRAAAHRFSASRRLVLGGSPAVAFFEVVVPQLRGVYPRRSAGPTFVTPTSRVSK